VTRCPKFAATDEMEAWQKTQSVGSVEPRSRAPAASDSTQSDLQPRFEIA